jgi:hypothetical protein
MLSEAMSRFISIALHVEGLAPYPEQIQGAWRADSPGKSDVEAGLRELLQTRELTAADWVKMTDVEFDSDDDLYRYLQKLYDYLFSGAEDPPQIP